MVTSVLATILPLTRSSSLSADDRADNIHPSLRYDRAVAWRDQFAEYRERMGQFMHGVAFGRYELELRQQTAELHDLFLLLCFMEATALPNPATLYLLEVYPYLLEQFHEWHRRMGIEHSPIGSLPCC